MWTDEPSLIDMVAVLLRSVVEVLLTFCGRYIQFDSLRADAIVGLKNKERSKWWCETGRQDRSMLIAWQTTVVQPMNA